MSDDISLHAHLIGRQGSRADLKPGEHIFAVATLLGDYHAGDPA